MSEQDSPLEISPFQIDNGELVGRHPSDVSFEILSLKFRAQNPVKAHRARCLDCCCEDASEVRKCVTTDCPAWPFRMGTNPFRKKPVLSEAERQRRTALLQGAPPAIAKEKPRSRFADRAEAQPKPSPSKKRKHGVMKIRPEQLSRNTLPLFAAVRASELRFPVNPAAKKLAQRYRLSSFSAKAIARANGLGPREDR